MKKRIKVFVLLICTIAIAIYSLNVYAVASSGNPSSDIYDKYVLGEKLKGWINISLDDEPANNLLADNQGNSIKIIDFLNAGKINYSCVPEKCTSDYSLSGAEDTSKKFSVASGGSGEKIIGIVLHDNDIEVTKFSFSVSSDAQASCTNQISIDILDDGTIDWKNRKALNENCGSPVYSSCYQQGSYDTFVEIVEEPYCEKISLKQASATDIKAFIKKEASAVFSSGVLKAGIYDLDGIVGECNLLEPSTEGVELSCTVDTKTISDGDYFACISVREGAVDENGLSGFKIKSRTAQPYCGFKGDPSTTSLFVKDYQISAIAKKYGAVGAFAINETSFSESTGDSLVSYINNYLDSQYNKQCSENECIIPIAFKGTAQEITISNVELRYSSTGSGGTLKDKAAELIREPAKLNLDFSAIDISKANFSTPKTIGKYALEIKLGTIKVADKEINVSAAPSLKVKYLYPRAVAAAYPTTFHAFIPKDNSIGNVSSQGNSSTQNNNTANNSNQSQNTPAQNNLLLPQIKLVWKFGDNTPEQTSTEDSIKHTYGAVGNYTMEITLYKGEEMISTSSFNINAKSPKDAINTTLANYKKRILGVSGNLSALNTEYKSFVESSGVDIEEIDSEVTSAETEYKKLVASSDSTDDEYVKVMEKLLAIDVPVYVEKRISGEEPLLYDLTQIDLNALENIFEQDAGSYEEEYKNEIFKWFLDNLDVKLNYDVISVYYEQAAVDLFTEFNLEISPKQPSENNGYFIINEDEGNILFSGETPVFEGNAGGISFPLSGIKNINFAVKGGSEAPFMFISPEFSELSVGGNTETPERGKSYWWIVLIYAALIIAALAAYIFLQEWYKKNYENSLFKDKSELYNLMAFIKNARQQGIAKKDMSERLKKSGWKGEQISYAENKLDGKRIGMWELPLLSYFQKKKMNEEVNKRGNFGIQNRQFV